MDITREEAQVIAGITSNPGYILLMERLQAGVDTLSDRLHGASGAETECLLPLWRALRTVVIELRFAPQEMIKFLEALNVDDRPTDINSEAQNQLDTFLNNFNKIRQNQTSTLSELLPTATDKKWTNNSFGNLL